MRLHVLPRAGGAEPAGHGHRAAVRLAHLLELPGGAVDDVLAGRRPQRGRGAPALSVAEDAAEPRAWSVATPARADVPYVFLAGEASLVRAARRAYDQKKKLPEELVARFARTTARANSIWIRAREESSFPAFSPVLAELVGIAREMAAPRNTNIPTQ